MKGKKWLATAALALLLLPSVSLAKGTNPNNVEDAVGRVIDPAILGELDITPWLASMQSQDDVRARRLNGFVYPQVGEMPFVAILIDLQTRVENLENNNRYLQQQLSNAQVSLQNQQYQAPQIINVPNDLTPRVEQLERRVGYLEMALEYFNGWVGKFKTALKIRG